MGRSKRIEPIDPGHPAAKPWEIRPEDLEQLPAGKDEQGRPIRTASRTRQQALRNADMVRISALLLQGASMEDMVREIGITKETVKMDLMHLNALWVNQIKENSENYRAVLLHKLMKLEALALESFEDSKEKVVTERSESSGEDGGGVRTSVKTYSSAGDAAFLNVAKDTIKMQVAVLGLDGQPNSVKAFDKEAFLEAVAEKVAEAKLASASVPAVAAEIEEVEQPKGEPKSPLL
jgi:hypothetical protein